MRKALFVLAGMLWTGSMAPAQGPALRISETSLTFRAPAGGDATPVQVVRVTPATPERSARFAVSVEPAPNYGPPDWLVVFGVPGGGAGVFRTTPARLIVRANPARLDPGVYRARIRVVPAESSSATAVEVEFQVVAQPPELEVLPRVLRFVARRGGGPRSQVLLLRNAGGRGVAPVRPEFTRPVPWATLAPAGSLENPGDLAAVRVIVDPGGLRPGIYRAQLRFDTPAGQGPVLRPITLLVLDDSGLLQVDPTGLQLEMRPGEGTIVTRRLQVINGGLGTLRWTARILQGAEWIRMSQTSGQAGAEPGGIDIQVSNRNLAEGAYYGLIEIASPGALGSPQYATVALRVRPPADSAGPVAIPEGLLFLVNEGGAAATQRVRVFSSARGRVGFQAATATEDNLGWLRAGSASGETATDAPADLEVTVNPANLKRGLYFGEINLTLSNEEIRSVNVVAVVTPRGTATAAGGAAEGCTPRRLAAVVTSAVSGFSTSAGWPMPITVKVADDCGVPVNDAQAVVNFSSGDPPLPLRRLGGDGLYTATWAPGQTGRQINVTVRVSAPPLELATANLSGEVTASGAPVLAPGGTVNNFSFAGAGVIAPGMVASVFGAGLSSTESKAASAELPRELGGTRVLVSGQSAPLYFVTPSQLGIQIPHELTDAAVHQIVVSANGQLSLPDALEAGLAAPGLLAAGETIVAQRPDGTFVSAAAPARRGEALVLYLIGMGRTEPGAVTGTPAPAALANVRQAPAVTVGGAAATVLFAGLTPGFVGLYQINILVPTDVPPGDQPVEVTQNGFSSNRATLPVGP